MTTKNAIKKLTSLGFKVEQDNRRYTVVKDHYILQFRQNGPTQEDNIVCIGIRHINDQSDSYTDYCAYTFFDNLSQAIRCL